MKLHELTDIGLKVQELFESGEDIAVALTQIQGEFNEKVLSCGMVYRNYIAEAGVYETESKRLDAKKESLKNRAEHLRKYVEREMETLGVDAVKGDTFSVKFHKLPDMVNIVDKDKIPHEYCRHKPEEWEPEKKKLLEVMNDGTKVEGAEVLTDRRKVEIK